MQIESTVRFAGGTGSPRSNLQAASNECQYMLVGVHFAAMRTRREFIKSGLTGAAVMASRGIVPAAPQAASTPRQVAGDGDVVLVNGKFVDGRGVVASALTIKNGRIVNVGQANAPVPGAQTI